MSHPTIRPATGDRYPFRPALLTLVAVGCLLFLRRPEQFLHPQFWAEDGAIFFLEAKFHGAAALVHPYAGYHHLLIRIVAALASGLDPRWIPAVYFWASLGVVALLVLALFSRRLTLERRPALALAIPLVPHTGEAFHNLTNVQWISALGLVLLLLVHEPERRWQALADVGVAALLGLTGVFSVLLAPLFIARALWRRTWSAAALAATVSVAAVIQANPLTHAPPSSATTTSTLVEFLATAGLRVWGSLLLPARWAMAIPAGGMAAIGLLLTVGIVILAARRLRERPERMILAAALVLVTVATLFKFNGLLVILSDPHNGDRYFVIPKIVVLWLFLLEWNGPARWFARAGVVLALIASLSAFRFEPYANYHWPEWAARIKAGERVVVPINPAGTTFVVPERK